MTGPVLDEALLGTLKEALLRKRAEILATSTGTRRCASVDVNSRQGDLADQASGNNRSPHSAQAEADRRENLQAIEEALPPGEGSCGLCRDCGEPIAPARLEAIPWTRVCIACKQKQNA